MLVAVCTTMFNWRQGVRLADDEAMTASTEAEIQEMVDTVLVEDYRMKTNSNKTKMVRLSRKMGMSMHINCKGQHLEQGYKCMYLGSL